jgi:hypothetical protein
MLQPCRERRPRRSSSSAHSASETRSLPGICQREDSPCHDARRSYHGDDQAADPNRMAIVERAADDGHVARFRHYDRRVRNASPLTLLLITSVLAGCGDGSSETGDAAANDAILSQLPTYPHAQIYDKSVNAYQSEYVGGAEPLGHTTNVNYQVPEGTDPVALVRFYSSRLEPEWRCRTAQGEPLLHCGRGTATLGVNPDNLGATPPRYELVVDHNDRTP